MTYLEFISRYPEWRGLPEKIVGANGKQVSIMEATMADLKAYQKFLAARASRRVRRGRARGARC